MLVGVITDIKNGVTRPCYAGDKPAAMAVIADKIPAMLKFIGENKFLAGDNVTFVDFYWYELVELMAFVSDGSIYKDYSVLKTMHDTMSNLPGLKEYLADPNCLDKHRTFNNKHAKINNVVS